LDGDFLKLSKTNIGRSNLEIFLFINCQAHIYNFIVFELFSTTVENISAAPLLKPTVRHL
jgi:hypothetical protein